MSALIELSRNQIDEGKWNELIKKSENGLLYHSIHYLDTMTNKWNAIIYGNYEFALPITPKNILGYTFLQQPPFIQQLGIIGNNITKEIINLFIEFLKEKFDFIHYSLNFNNPMPNLEKKNNFTIALHQSYDQITKNFNNDVQANLKKARKNIFKYKVNEDPGKSIFLFKKLYGPRFRHIKNSDFRNLALFCNNHKQNWLSREVYLNEDLCASCLILKDSKRLYFLINNVTEKGRNNEANYFLLDQLIREFTEKPLLLDFEGSDLKGVSEFYQKFGATNEPYYSLYFNQLPFFLKVFKK